VETVLVTLRKIMAILLLAMGVTAHDIASFYGLHIPGIHAFYFSVPIMLICMFILSTGMGKKKQ